MEKPDYSKFMSNRPGQKGEALRSTKASGLLMLDYRASKRVLLSAVVSALVAFYSLDLPWGMEEEKAAARGERTFEAETEDATATTTDTESTEEDDFQIPEEKPENAVFIPLGFTRQLPHTFYKGTDPEWQSFMEFAKNKQRTLAIRSKLLSMKS